MIYVHHSVTNIPVSLQQIKLTKCKFCHPGSRNMAAIYWEQTVLFVTFHFVFLNQILYSWRLPLSLHDFLCFFGFVPSWKGSELSHHKTLCEMWHVNCTYFITEEIFDKYSNNDGTIGRIVCRLKDTTLKRIKDTDFQGSFLRL